MATMISHGEDSQLDGSLIRLLGRQEIIGKPMPANECYNVSSSISSHTADYSSVSSRCSVKLIHETVSRFSPEKVELVRSIGFGGLLHIPLLKQINLRFSTWLMSRVDELSQTLIISEDCRIKFEKSDVAKVFGIPSSGRSILSNPSSSTDEEVDVVNLGCTINTESLRSLKSAIAIVSRSYGGIMSSAEQDEFKAAFVVVAMSALLAPVAKHDRVGDGYMHAIVHPVEISSYDWSEYVLRRLLDAVSKLKLDIVNNVKSPYIHGCSLFLQVLFLDSIDLGVLSMPHTMFPRIRCFTADRLRSMIVVVTSMSANGAEVAGSRKTKLRNSTGICYHWANCQLPSVCVSNDSAMFHLWEAVLLMTRVLKIPLEAAGPLFVAAADMQRRQRSEVGSEVMENLCVLLHLMEPFVNGFSYQSSFNGNDHLNGLCPLRHPHTCRRSDCCLHFASINSKRNSWNGRADNASSSQAGACVNKRRYSSIELDVHLSRIQSFGRSGAVQQNFLGREVSQSFFPDAHEFDLRAINAMARFYLLLRPVRATRCTDLNLPARTESNNHVSSAPRSPWELGFTLSIDVSRAAVLRRKLSFVDDTDEPWIVHFCPKYIEVLTGAIKAQIFGQSEIEMEFFDAVIRRYKQLDDDLYSAESNVRWRHFVESDFMVSLLAGWFVIFDPVVRSHFCSRHIDYDVTGCEILFFPVLLQYRWACFAWRMKDNTIVVYDPCLSQQASSLVSSSYESIVSVLRSDMALVASTYFPSWSNQWDKGSIEFFKSNILEEPCINRSGLRCLYFCRCFDGHRLVPPLTEGLVEDWAALVLGDVSELAGNIGSVLAVFC